MEDHLDATLTALFELLQYSIQLQSSHYQASALLANNSDRCDLATVKKNILKRMEQEWRLVLKMESSTATNHLLSKHCYFTCWQAYRETMLMAESHKFQLTEPLCQFLRSYHPAVQGSANVEDLFSDLQDSILRSSKADCGSLANLAAVSIRSCNRKSTTAELQSPQLISADFEGNSIRSLKTSVFKPETCSSSHSFWILKQQDFVVFLTHVFAVLQSVSILQ